MNFNFWKKTYSIQAIILASKLNNYIATINSDLTILNKIKSKEGYFSDKELNVFNDAQIAFYEITTNIDSISKNLAEIKNKIDSLKR
jgi:hypothetical protein